MTTRDPIHTLGKMLRRENLIGQLRFFEDAQPVSRLPPAQQERLRRLEELQLVERLDDGRCRMTGCGRDVLFWHRRN